MDALFSSLKKSQEEGTPNEDGSCKKADCGGRVVQRVTGLFHGQYSYSIPECKECGAVYTYADPDRTPKVGLEEFQESLKRPTTI